MARTSFDQQNNFRDELLVETANDSLRVIYFLKAAFLGCFS